MYYKGVHGESGNLIRSRYMYYKGVHGESGNQVISMDMYYKGAHGESGNQVISMDMQCSKLRVHPAPIGTLHPSCTLHPTCTIWLAHFGTFAPGEFTFFQSISIHFIGLCTQNSLAR